MKYQRIAYDDLNAKQQEAYNFQKISGILADYGFITIALSDDWNGADFLAVHKDGDTLKVQLKGRMTFDKKYMGKDLHICFRNGHDLYIYPHDELLNAVNKLTNILGSESWHGKGQYHFPTLSEKHKPLLEAYKYSGAGLRAA